MNILVTGVTGVVGKYIVKELLKTSVNDKIVGISRKARYFYEDHPDRDSAMYIECFGDLQYNGTRLITQFKPDYIYHCAGLAITNSPSKELWEANVNTTLNLLEACKKLSKVTFVYCSSVVTKLRPLTLYAASKIAGETLVDSYSSMNDNIKGLTITFPAVAGAGNKHGVVKDVVKKLKNDNTIMSLYGDRPGSRKPIVYAGQLAREIINLSRNLYFSNSQLFPTDTITVEDIAKIGMHVTGIEKDIEWLPQEVWKGDHRKVSPLKSCVLMYPSDKAVTLAMQDILEEDYPNE